MPYTREEVARRIDHAVLQPTMTVEYEGPVFITYEEPIVHIVCYGYTEDLHYFESSFPRNVRANATFSDFSSFRNEKYVVGKIGIDIHDPKFCDILGEFLDIGLDGGKAFILFLESESQLDHGRTAQ